MVPLHRFIFIILLLTCIPTIEAGEVLRDTSYSLNSAFLKVRKKYPEANIEPIVNNKNQIKHVKELIYTSFISPQFGTKNLKLDLFLPNDSHLHPAVIMVHGGGWRSGDKSMENGMATELALAGFVAIPIEYRLSMEAKYPAAIIDIKSAICWVKANANHYNIDTTRIAIEGNSAGGQLATLVGLTPNSNQFIKSPQNMLISDAVKAIINIDGVVDFLAPASLNLPRTSTSPDVAWLGGTYEQIPQIWKEASPIFHLNEKSVPILFINSAQHRFHAGEAEMVDLMNQFSIYHEIEEIENAPHTFWLFSPWQKQTTSAMIRFLHKVFE